VNEGQRRAVTAYSERDAQITDGYVVHTGLLSRYLERYRPPIDQKKLVL
jgi:hypothetical protein